jgi:hypothetical protein
MPVHSFHFFGILGYCSGVLLGIFLSHSLKLPVYIIFLLSGIGAFTFFLLAMLAKVLTNEDTIVYYHHEIAILLVCGIFLRATGFPLFPYLDITILGIGIFLAFGRIGCFSMGCCHGKPSRIGIQYGANHVRAGFGWYYQDITLSPVQLIESGYAFLIVITGTILLSHKAAPGTVLVFYTSFYGGLRYFMEFFRGDAERPYKLGLSEAQWTTLLLIIVFYAFAFMGRLPLYPWHTGILILILTASLYMIAWGRKDPVYRMFIPEHVKELASGVVRISRDNTLTGTHEYIPDQEIPVYRTRLGLCISNRRFTMEALTIDFYTVSSINKKLPLTKRAVTSLATLLGIIGHHDTPSRIEEIRNQIYQIFFIIENKSVVATQTTINT